MRFDLIADLEVERRYALLDLEGQAATQRTRLCHPTERADMLAASHEAQRFLDGNSAESPGQWITSEVAAHAEIGMELSATQAATEILARNFALATKGAELHRIIRTAELKLNQAKSVSDIQKIASEIQWPKIGDQK